MKNKTKKNSETNFEVAAKSHLNAAQSHLEAAKHNENENNISARRSTKEAEDFAKDAKEAQKRC